MEYTKATAIDYFFNKIDAKEMEFSAIRKTLEGDGFEKDEINIIVRHSCRTITSCDVTILQLLSFLF